MSQITWKITELERLAADGLVVRAHWQAATDDTDDAANSVGVVELVRGDAFVPFEELTQQIVLAWVKDALGADRVAEVELLLVQTADERANLKTIAGKPWATFDVTRNLDL